MQLRAFVGMKLQRLRYDTNACPARLLPRGKRLAIGLTGLLLCGLDVRADLLVSTESPIAFFTNVATHLLKSELNLDLNRIQVYPTNQYTPAVHRLLQFTANVYDAITNRAANGYPYPPSVFRPMFMGKSGANGIPEIYITGYEELTNKSFATSPPYFHDLSDTNDLSNVGSQDMVYGIPLVIGAKKGFPAFNEFAMQTRVQVQRRLEFRRLTPGGAIDRTNQMFVVGISNTFGVEAWNSYSNAYPRRLKIITRVDARVTVTNEVPGQELLNGQVGFLTNYCTSLELQRGAWAGYPPLGYGEDPRPSFQVPLITNFMVLSNSAYVQSEGRFVALAGKGVFENPSHFPIPHWWLNLNNRLRFILIDVDADRIVDYVNLNSWEDTLAITDTLMRDGQCGDFYVPDASDGSLWCTNRVRGNISEDAPTYGILNQMLVGLGVVHPEDWNSFVLAYPPGLDPRKAIDFFRAQFGLSPLSYEGWTFYKSNIFLAPFSPVRDIYLHTSWQANDPLVHYMKEDLKYLLRGSSVDFHGEGATIGNLGAPNQRYQPWGGDPYSPSTNTKFDLTLKDPLVRRSDDWNFPNSEPLSSSFLGRVHRGTPWQTFYLKSAIADPGTWLRWSGVDDPKEGSLTHPTNDWRLASLLAPLFNTNRPGDLISANEKDTSVMKAALDGMVVLTNALTDEQFQNPFLSAQFDSVIMQATSPQAAAITDAIVAKRSTQPGHYFRQLGDVLSTPQLSLASPWLNTNSPQQLTRGISDEAYEAVSSQLLTKLRPDSFGAVIRSGNVAQIQFSGFDGYRYIVQTSSNLLDWVPVSTNYPTNGSFTLLDGPPALANRYYRSILVP